MAQAVTNLRGSTEQVLGGLLAGRRPGALIDFPNYPNVGDSAIYLGQLACLRSLGIARPAFISDLRTYDRQAMARRIGDGVILLSGGGTFGDLWPTAQECREEILAAFPDNPVIQLPQSMHFESRDAFDRARAAVARHRRLTLLWRDTASLETATRELDAPSHLCPDMAFCLGPLKRLRSGTQPIVWLSRRDRERAIDPPAEAGGVTDWLDERHTALRRANYALMGATTRLTPRSLWHRLLMKTYVPLATQRLDRGIEKLSVAEVVITDRLHGSVLAMLLQIPHVLVDNAHGKLSAFHDTWLRDVEGVRFARSAEEAVMMANGLLEGPSSPQRRDIAR